MNFLNNFNSLIISGVNYFIGITSRIDLMLKARVLRIYQRMYGSPFYPTSREDQIISLIDNISDVFNDSISNSIKGKVLSFLPFIRLYNSIMLVYAFIVMYRKVRREGIDFILVIMVELYLSSLLFEVLLKLIYAIFNFACLFT